RRRHTRVSRDWSSDVCSSDLKRSVARSGPRGADLDHVADRDLVRVRSEMPVSPFRPHRPAYHHVDRLVGAGGDLAVALAELLSLGDPPRLVGPAGDEALHLEPRGVEP